MLSDDSIAKCDEISERTQKHYKYDKPVTIATAIILFAGLSAALSFLASFGSEIAYYITIIFVIVIAISLIVGIVNGIKLRKFKISDMDEVILAAYKAHFSLNNYIEKTNRGEEIKDLDITINNIKKISFEIFLDWKNYSRYHSIIPTLDSHITKFSQNISKLELVIEDEQIDKKVILNILAILIEFLLSNKKDNFQEINKAFSPLDSIPPKLSREEKIKGHLLEFLKKEKSKKMIKVNVGLLSVGLVGIAVLANFGFTSESILTYLLITTIGPLIFFWLNYYEIKIGSH